MQREWLFVTSVLHTAVAQSKAKDTENDEIVTYKCRYVKGSCVREVTLQLYV